jgi:hypothetical protein
MLSNQNSDEMAGIIKKLGSVKNVPFKLAQIVAIHLHN